MKYEEIEKVNKKLNSVDIKGKDYIEVNQRVKAFRMLYPEGFITTEIISVENGVCIIKATAGTYNDDGSVKVLGTGTAYEKENSTFINKTSYIENCETSAIGRALGICGIGIDTSVASAEEVVNAINNQNKKEPTYREQLIAYCKERNLDTKEISDSYNLSKDSTEEDYKKALTNLKVGE